MFMGRDLGVGGLFGGRDNRLCCAWYSVAFGGAWLVG